MRIQLNLSKKQNSKKINQLISFLEKLEQEDASLKRGWLIEALLDKLDKTQAGGGVVSGQSMIVEPPSLALNDPTPISVSEQDHFKQHESVDTLNTPIIPLTTAINDEKNSKAKNKLSGGMP